tara:strand:- start:165 stop:911 length:747 start_codon:yes stop_codon:yes gene_type:complete
MYDTEENAGMKNDKVDMMCDDDMCDCMNPAIDSLKRSFNMIVVGRPGSGKTNWLINLLKQGQYQDERKGLRKMFHNVVVCSPSISSLKKNVFSKIDDSQLFEEFDTHFIQFVKELTEIETENNHRTLVICDDVGTQLRKDAQVEKAFLQMAFNRRHRRLSIITTVQSYKNLPVGLRTSASHLVLFRPTNQKELIAVWEEVLGPIPRQNLNKFIEWIFDVKHNFLWVDMSLICSPKFVFYKNWERIKDI